MQLFGIGLSALNAAQLGLSTTGHNIANASSAGYHRQEIFQSVQTPTLTGAGFVGNGTYVENIRRSYSQFLDGQVMEVEGVASYLTTYRNGMEQVDNLLGDAKSGLAPAQQEFFRTMQEVAANPASVPARQLLLSATQSMVARFQTMDKRLEDLYIGANRQIEDSISEVNALAKQIAELNKRVISAESNAGKLQANDLRDQREKLIADLNKIARTQVSVDSEGNYNVFVGTGQSLVVGPNASALKTQRSAENPQKLDIFATNGFVDVLIPPASLSGGRIGALFAYRDESLSIARSELGREAMVMANAINQQHQLGQDLQGNFGGAYFTVASPVAFASTNNSSASVMSATVSNYSQLVASDYRVTFTGVGAYSVTRLSDNTVFTGSPATVDGVNLSFSVPANTGDVFYLQPTVAGSSTLKSLVTDPVKVAAALPLRTVANLANTGTAKLEVQSNSSTAGIPASGTMRTLTFNAGAYTSSVGTDTVALSGNTLTVTTAAGNVITMSVTGTPANGDTFNLDRNTGGVSDGRNAVLLGKIATTNLLNGGTTTLQGAYGQLVSLMGNKSRELKVTGEAQDTLLKNVTQVQQSFSGVNLDEEAARLIQYQQAYQAASKLILTAKQTLEEIFSVMR
ncbi:flagellar hook-associated protein FlgK [Leeia aquatica]|uniref:Flagellar hook-associated protein 1 n=1 Tax=Leeia aquatica TaxID=2725557 RepID=A0A847S7A0_9NEIS|nr:flagellar hook-associated protein FlgK [Leeia aquatica]NLR75804.1 flagellar hook-associated protein FlgK [Leeia aquatica]